MISSPRRRAEALCSPSHGPVALKGQDFTPNGFGGTASVIPCPFEKETFLSAAYLPHVAAGNI
jgi:hypothetical protein